jgi:hypothetical protein
MEISRWCKPPVTIQKKEPALEGRWKSRLGFGLFPVSAGVSICAIPDRASLPNKP